MICQQLGKLEAYESHRIADKGDSVPFLCPGSGQYDRVVLP